MDEGKWVQKSGLQPGKGLMLPTSAPVFLISLTQNLLKLSITEAEDEKFIVR